MLYQLCIATLVRSLLKPIICVSNSASAATPLPLSGAGTVCSYIAGLVVLHVNMTRQTTRIKYLMRYRVF